MAREAERPAAFPKLFWAGIILFTLNLITAAGFWLRPELRVGMYGREVQRVAAFKPSPWTPAVSTAKVKAPRAAEKLRPIVFDESAAATEAAPEAPAFYGGASYVPAKASSNWNVDAAAPVMRTDALNLSLRNAQEYETPLN